MVETDLFKTKFISAKVESQKLMLVLHGKGDSLDPFMSFNEELAIPEMNYLLLNAPRKFLDGYSWYGDPPHEERGVLKIREKMLQLLKDLEAQGWKSENIFLLGFSQGCLVSADVALNYPKPLGGVVGVSGYFHFFPRWKSQLKENRKTPWIFTHGKKDDVLSFDNTFYGAEKLKLAGMKVDFVEINKKHIFADQDYPTIRRWVQNQMSSL